MLDILLIFTHINIEVIRKKIISNKEDYIRHKKKYTRNRQPYLELGWLLWFGMFTTQDSWSSLNMELDDVGTIK